MLIEALTTASTPPTFCFMGLCVCQHVQAAVRGMQDQYTTARMLRQSRPRRQSVIEQCIPLPTTTSLGRQIGHLGKQSPERREFRRERALLRDGIYPDLGIEHGHVEKELHVETAPDRRPKEHETPLRQTKAA